MAVTGSRNQRREISCVVLGRPDPIFGDTQRRETDPFRARRAMIVPVEAGMVHQNRQTAAHQHEDEKDIEEVTPPYPERKSVGSGGASGNRRGGRRQMRQAKGSMLNPCRR